jgi:hypothetical protein
MNEKGQATVVSVFEEIILECGIDVFRKVLFELKFPPKPPAGEKPKQEESQSERTEED